MERKKTGKRNPVLKASFLSKLFFLWTRHIFKKGYRKNLGPEDIYDHVPDLDSQRITESFAEHWETELKRKDPSLLHMIFRSYGLMVIPYCILYTIFEIVVHAVQPLIIGGLVNYFSQDQTDISKETAYFYGACLILLSFAEAICFSVYNTFMCVKGNIIRLACCGLIYRKCLKISINVDFGQLKSVALSTISKDLLQLDSAFSQIHNIWKGPIEVIVYIVIMWFHIGWPAVVGIAVFICIQPFQAWGGKAIGTFKCASAKYGDQRISLLNELISAIRVIKMNVWEIFFTKEMSSLRKQETSSIFNAMKINACLQSSTIISKLALFLYLLILLLTGKPIRADFVFITTLYYSNLSSSILINYSMVITIWAEILVSIKRANTFLLHGTKSVQTGVDNPGLEVIEQVQQRPIKRLQNEETQKTSLKLHQVFCSWEKSTGSRDRTNHLTNINIEISDAQFVGIIGNVGSGKTTLLSAIIGECEIIQGLIELKGVLSYASQDPWIFGGSLRDNIVFVEEFDESRYRDVLNACELNRDIDMMPNGDLTIIGERGVNLSGGQKARVNLARAIYRKADIYLFDDPLSAVDTIVGRSVMDKCFLKFLNNKIRILVTHQTQYLVHVDRLIVMEGGFIKFQGPYHHLRDSVLENMQTESKTIEPDYKPKSKVSSEKTIENLLADFKDINRTEDQANGKVKFSTYLSYFQALRSPFLMFIVLSLFLLARACQGALDIFTAKWATLEDSHHFGTDNENIVSKSQNYFIMVFVLTCVVLVLYLLRTFSFFYVCHKISTRLHEMILNSIARAQLNFFDVNPSGRIINRFASDLWKADVLLPVAMENSFWFFVDTVAILLIVGLTNQWLLIPSFLLLALIYKIRDVYIRSSRNLKRIESISFSPILSHINQTLQGLATIRVLNGSNQAQQNFNKLQNTNIGVWYLSLTTSRALSLWVDLLCWMYTALVIIFLLLLENYFNSGQVGLVLTQSIVLLGKCQQGVRKTADMENYMTSLERIMEYTRIPSEGEQKTPENTFLDPNWPSKGSICFVDLRLRYTESGPFVLKGLNFSIKPKEKIGILGRTGAGKSSISQALLCLAFNEGVIEIDGQNISAVGLNNLRRSISMIPQEPILFTGTLRFNLDPFEEKTDAELWNALENVELKTYVMGLESGLECQVYDGGVNFSTGQRQLICLARAILRRNKILIMDEATANVDSNTDQLIQEKIQKNFSECTVITIAHRLKTVMHNDRVMVMDAGYIVELDHPYKLLQNENGFLYKLVQQTGKDTAESLVTLARKSFEEQSAKENSIIK